MLHIGAIAYREHCLDIGTMLLSQKCEISSEDIPLMKSKNRYDPSRRPKEMRFRMGAQMTNSRILVR